jgi:hypothetical protein
MSVGAQGAKQSQKKRKCPKKKEEEWTCCRQLIDSKYEEYGENYEKESVIATRSWVIQFGRDGKNGAAG